MPQKFVIFNMITDSSLGRKGGGGVIRKEKGVRLQELIKEELSG